MARFLAKRSLLVFVMLFGLLIITFVISHIAPGDPARLAAGPDATHEMVERVRTEYGLDKPLPYQFFIYLGGVLSGDWGKSIHTTHEVMDDLLHFFPATFELVMFSIVIAVGLGVPMGIVAAVYQNTWMDHGLRIISVCGVALPMFWLGIMLQFAFSLHVELFPLGGRLSVMTDPPVPITHLILVDTLLRGEFDKFIEACHYMVPCLSGYHPHPLYVVCLLGLQARAGAGALRRRSG